MPLRHKNVSSATAERATMAFDQIHKTAIKKKTPAAGGMGTGQRQGCRGKDAPSGGIGGAGTWTAPSAQAADFTSTLRSFCFASGVFGNVTVSTPLAKSAETDSASTPEGRERVRWNSP